MGDCLPEDEDEGLSDKGDITGGSSSSNIGGEDTESLEIFRSLSGSEGTDELTEDFLPKFSSSTFLMILILEVVNLVLIKAFLKDLVFLMIAQHSMQ